MGKKKGNRKEKGNSEISLFLCLFIKMRSGGLPVFLNNTP